MASEPQDRVDRYLRCRRVAREYLSGLAGRRNDPDLDFGRIAKLLGMYRKDLKDMLVRRCRAGLKMRFVIDKSITRFLLFLDPNRRYGDEYEMRGPPGVGWDDGGEP